MFTVLPSAARSAMVGFDLPEKEALIGSVHDVGVVEEVFLVQMREDPTDVVIDRPSRSAHRVMISLKLTVWCEDIA